MKINDILTLLEYKHRPDYKGNKKGSYIEAGKTYWDYSDGQKVGTERVTTQICDKARRDFDVYISRTEVKRYLKSESSQKLFDRIKRSAVHKFGSDESNSHYKAYLYGGFVRAAAKVVSKGKNKGISYLL